MEVKNFISKLEPSVRKSCDIETELFSGTFHISSRVNALPAGAIMVPNVFRVTMPRYMNGWAYLDNVIIERRGE